MEYPKNKEKEKPTTTAEDDKAFKNFIESISSKSTLTLYTYGLKDFAHRFLKVDRYGNLLPPHISPEKLQELLYAYIKDLQENKRLAPSSFRSFLAGIKFFFEINEITNYNWRNVSRRIGEVHGVVRDRIPTKQELQMILDKCDLRKKVCFLIMISGGLRIDALASLKVGDLEKVKLDDDSNSNSGTEEIYKLIVYRNAKEEYRTFVSVECTQGIDAYLSFRRNRGEIIQDSSSLIRKNFRESDANIDVSPPKIESLENVLQ